MVKGGKPPKITLNQPLVHRSVCHNPHIVFKTPFLRPEHATSETLNTAKITAKPPHLDKYAIRDLTFFSTADIFKPERPYCDSPLMPMAKGIKEVGKGVCISAHAVSHDPMMAEKFTS